MMVKSLPLIVVAFVSFTAWAADAYRWEDAQGRVYYSDQLPPTGARNIQRTHVDDNGNQEPLPYRLQVAVDSSPVTLYVTDCGKPCDLARQLLVKRGIPHKMLDASNAEVQKDLAELLAGELEVPVLTVGDTILRGYQEGQWNSALDAAGYPSYAMIKIKPKTLSKDKKTAKAASSSGKTDATANDMTETQPTEPETEDTAEAGVDAQANKNDGTEPAEAEQAQ
jgi:hypothetical protein